MAKNLSKHIVIQKTICTFATDTIVLNKQLFSQQQIR